jgi:hypothetical protein
MLAAQWLDKSLRDGQVVALSWGSTLQAVVNAVAVERPRKVEVVPLVGALSTTASLATAQELVRELAARLGGSYRYLHAPALLQSAGAGAALRAEPAIREAFDHALSADIAMVGIGAVGGGSSAQILDGLALTPTQRAEFFAANPVGDTCCRFFDAAGNQIQGEVYDRVLAVDLADLPRIPTVANRTGACKIVRILHARDERARDVRGRPRRAWRATGRDRRCGRPDLTGFRHPDSGDCSAMAGGVRAGCGQEGSRRTATRRGSTGSRRQCGRITPLRLACRARAILR